MAGPGQVADGHSYRSEIGRTFELKLGRKQRLVGDGCE